MVQPVDSPPPPHQRDRSAMLAVLLGLAMALGLLGFFWMVAPEFFLVLVATVGGITLYGGLHYLLWGRGFMKETAAERAALAAADKADAAAHGGPLPHDRRY